MRKYFLVLVLPFLAALSSCTKIAGTVISNSNNLSATYQPLTSGSTWTYRTDYSGAGFAFIDTAIIVMSSKTYTINSKLYQQAYSHKPSTPSLVDTGYYYTTNHEYSLMQTVAAPGTTNSYAFEMLYLKDNLAVGGTWSSSTTNSFLGTIGLTGKIVEKGITKTVAGKTFANVIHTNVKLSITYQGISAVDTYDIYVAQGVGIIHLEVNTPGMGTIPEDLVSYSIK